MARRRRAAACCGVAAMAAWGLCFLSVAVLGARGEQLAQQQGDQALREQGWQWTWDAAAALGGRDTLGAVIARAAAAAGQDGDDDDAASDPIAAQVKTLGWPLEAASASSSQGQASRSEAVASTVVATAALLSSAAAGSSQAYAASASSSASAAVTASKTESSTQKKPAAIPVPITSLPKCPSAPCGFVARHNRSVAPGGAAGELLHTRSGLTLTALARECRQTPFCTAVDTLGNLWAGVNLTTPLAQGPPAGAAPLCYSLYVQKRPRSWVGLGARFEAHLADARQQGDAQAEEQRAFWEHVEAARHVTAGLSQAQLSAPATIDRVVASLGLDGGGGGGGSLRTRRLLGATDTLDPRQAAVQVLAAASAPAVWDPRRPNTTGGRAYPCKAMSQGDCGTCQAFSAVGAAQVAVAYAHRRACPVRLSMQQLYYCNGMFPLTCEEGWLPDEAAVVVTQRGLALNKCFPYTGKPGCTNKCNKTEDPMLPGHFSVKVFGGKAKDITAAKQFLREQGGIYTYFDAYSDLYRYKRGVYKYDGRSRYMGGHSVAVVGYDDEQQAWVAVNSWGTRWGDQGYFLVSYDNPVFMKGGYYNIVGVSYQRHDSPSPPPAPPKPPKPPASPPMPVPPPRPPPVTKPGIQCSATFFSGANLTGLALKLAFPRHVQSYERGCVYLDDFSSTKPSFAYKAVSYRLQCSCQGTGSATACYALAQQVTLMAWHETFDYIRDNNLDGTPGTMDFMESDCGRDGCKFEQPLLSKAWVRAVNAAALCFNKQDFDPYSSSQ